MSRLETKGSYERHFQLRQRRTIWNNVIENGRGDLIRFYDSNRGVDEGKAVRTRRVGCIQWRALQQQREYTR